jgi:hypothetical protein
MNEETDMTCQQAAAAIAALISKHAIRFTFEHVPTAPKEAQIVWRVTVERRGRAQTFRYSAGIAHLPCYAALLGPKTTLHNEAIIARELATGRNNKTGKPITPNAADVLNCLALDGEAINYATFEDWAREFGYDDDSRKAELTYKECLRAGLFLRAILGASGLEELQTISRFM